uniref:Uncharacterized protein n=1 Tax=Timema cristinae TaxID=61476 RepID=A0A7R9D1S2_TIMCR|nr:unnamed protein product [Timema cristinae]
MDRDTASVGLPAEPLCGDVRLLVCTPVATVRDDTDGILLKLRLQQSVDVTREIPLTHRRGRVVTSLKVVIYSCLYSYCQATKLAPGLRQCDDVIGKAHCRGRGSGVTVSRSRYIPVIDSSCRATKLAPGHDPFLYRLVLSSHQTGTSHQGKPIAGEGCDIIQGHDLFLSCRAAKLAPVIRENPLTGRVATSFKPITALFPHIQTVESRSRRGEWWWVQGGSQQQIRVRGRGHVTSSKPISVVYQVAIRITIVQLQKYQLIASCAWSQYTMPKDRLQELRASVPADYYRDSQVTLVVDTSINAVEKSITVFLAKEITGIPKDLPTGWGGAKTYVTKYVM